MATEGFFARLRSKPPVQQQPPQNNQQNNQQPNQQPNNQQQQNNQQPTGTNTNTGNPTAQISNDPLSVLDSHKDLYNPTESTNDVPAFNLDSDKLNGVVSSQDFMQGIDAAAMQKLQAGDMSALGDIINHATRNAYRAALQHGSTLTGKFVEARFGHADKGLDSRIRSSQLDDHLSRTPNFSNPVVKQQLTDIVKRLQQKHPDAPYEEVIEEGKRILNEVASSINPQTPNPAARPEQDWEAFMTQ